MITSTLEQREAFGSDHAIVDHRVQVLRSGSWVDLTQYLGEQWVSSVRVSLSEEQPAARATVVLRRESDAGTLAPLADARQTLRLGARIRVRVNGAALGDEFTGWVSLLEGHVEDVDFGGDDSEVTVECVDYMGLLVDATIKEERTYGEPGDGDEFGVSLSVTVLEIYNANRPAGAPPMNFVGPTNANVRAFVQEPANLLEAIQSLLAVRGWDIRARKLFGDNDPWGGWRIVVSVPQGILGNFTPDLVIPTDGYRALTAMRESSLGVIDEIVVKYRVETEESITTGSATARTSTPISLRGYRSRVIDATADPQIRDGFDALAMAEAAVLGTGRDPKGAVMVRSLDPFVELGDVHRLPPNNVHHANNYTAVVTGVDHELTPDQVTTTTSLRGAYTGGVYRYYQRVVTPVDSQRDPEEDPLEEVEEEFDPIPGVWWYYTTTDGNRGFSRPSTAEKSLGKYISITPVNLGVDGLFPPAPEEGGETIYRTVALYNASGCPIDPMRMILDLGTVDDSGTNDGQGLAWAFRRATNGSVPLRQVAQQGSWSGELAGTPNEFESPLLRIPAPGETEPQELSWSEATRPGTPAQYSLLRPGQCVLVHIRRTVSGSFIPRVTQDFLHVRQCFPAVA